MVHSQDDKSAATQQIDDLRGNMALSGVSNKSSRMGKSITYLIVGLVLAAVFSAVLILLKVVENNDQNKKLEEIQNQIEIQAKQMEGQL